MTTTKAAHTAGQWTVGHAGFERKPVVVARRAGRPATVCICDGGAREEDEANARLIAAAPELLAALKEIVAADDEAIRELAKIGLDASHQISALTEKARAAIAKATGA